MIKNITKFEYRVGERVYCFLCDVDSPLGEVHDALFKFKEQVINIIVEREKAQKETKDEQHTDSNN